MVIIPTDLDEFPAVRATFIKFSIFLEKCLAVAVITIQKRSYLTKAVAHLDFCLVFDNGLYQMIAGEM